MLDNYIPTADDLQQAQELECAEFCDEGAGPPSDLESEFIALVCEAFRLGPAPGQAATIGEARASLQAAREKRLAYFRRWWPGSATLAYFEAHPDQL